MDIGHDPTPDALRDAGWTQMMDDGFMEQVGPFWQRVGDDGVTCGFVAQERHMNPNGRVHGGMLATLADRTLGYTARFLEPTRHQATIDLTVHFIDAVRIREFVTGKGELLRQTSTLAFLAGRLEAHGRLVASLSGIFRIRPAAGAQGTPIVTD